MQRREFITLLGGAAAAWPLVARAQQGERMRRIGVLMDTAENNREGQARFAAFRQVLRERGWVEGQNLLIDVRWPVGDVMRAQAYATELVNLAPEVIFAIANAQIRPLSRATRTIPIIFLGASDPVGAGYVESIAHPGGNITGFTLFEPTMAGKWLSALKEVAPAVRQITIMVNPDSGTSGGKFYLREFESSAAVLAVEPHTAIVHNGSDIEKVIGALGQCANCALIVAPDGFTQAYDTFIVGLAATHRVPTVFGVANFARSGGLMSYGPDFVDISRRAAIYVDRVLRGEKPADLPVQAPTKFELVINLKTAKALGLEVPPSLLARADEVIE